MSLCNILAVTGVCKCSSSPFSYVPNISNPKQKFKHSRITLLGFTIPNVFKAFEVIDLQIQTLGLNNNHRIEDNNVDGFDILCDSDDNDTKDP
jgi:hypothetical protein